MEAEGDEMEFNTKGPWETPIKELSKQIKEIVNTQKSYEEQSK